MYIDQPKHQISDRGYKPPLYVTTIARMYKFQILFVQKAIKSAYDNFANLAKLSYAATTKIFRLCYNFYLPLVVLIANKFLKNPTEICQILKYPRKSYLQNR